MLNREWKEVSVVTFKNIKDEYGQGRTEIDSTRTVLMVYKIYAQVTTDSPIYNDVEMIGIIKDKDITDSNQIVINNVNYNILHVIPSGKYLQVLMKRAK